MIRNDVIQFLNVSRVNIKSVGYTLTTFQSLERLRLKSYNL